MTYYIAGSGNMAWFLVQRLTDAGHTCNGIYGRNKEKVAELAAAYQLPICQNPEDIQDDADVCILAIADKAIKEIAEKLSFEKTVLIHNAGGADMGLLANAARHYGVLWFIYSIVRQELPGHRQVPCVYEASSLEAKIKLKELAACITNLYYETDGGSRKRLHLGAVFANNFTNHMMAVAEQLCTVNNMPFALLQPIMQQTFERIKGSSPAGLQTGPARRNDENTMTEHMALLAGNPALQHMYEAINQSIKAMYNNSSEKQR